MANRALSEPAVDLREAEGVWWITFNRPEASNAFTLADLDRVAEIFRDAGDPPRAAVIWRKTVGSMMLADFLAEQNIEVPEFWDLSGGLTGISADGYTLVGWGSYFDGVNPPETRSYVIRLDKPDPLFANGFDPR